jgi:hypothetical protein
MMGLESFLVQMMGLSGFGMQIMPMKTVQHPLHVAVASHIQQQPLLHPTLRTITSFPSHQTRLMHYAALLSFSQASPMMTSGQCSLSLKKMDG